MEEAVTATPTSDITTEEAVTSSLNVETTMEEVVTMTSVTAPYTSMDDTETAEGNIQHTS